MRIWFWGKSYRGYLENVYGECGINGVVVGILVIFRIMYCVGMYYYSILSKSCLDI